MADGYKVMADVPSQRSKQGTVQGRLGILATVLAIPGLLATALIGTMSKLGG